MKFYDVVEDLLKKDERFVAENGTVLKNAVYEAAMNLDSGLIRLLLSNDDTKARFFRDIDGVMVFDKVGFGWVINNRQFLPDSYTRFKNKIGLADNQGDIISSTGKVELVFPYKDCILEGGQTKEDQKRKEVFYNETLAPDEVDRLLFPKVFTNIKKYTPDGIEKIEEFEQGDNLVIRGNNLLALASLIKRYEGKVKCIVYSIQHKKLLELADAAGTLYRIDGYVLINREVFEEYLEQFRQPPKTKAKAAPNFSR